MGKTVKITLAVSTAKYSDAHVKLVQPRQTEVCPLSLKGGDPPPPSDRGTLLRLHPSHRPHLRHLSLAS
jgi:hypothetical protein